MESLKKDLEKINKTIKKEQNFFKKKYSENALHCVDIYRQISEHDIAIYSCINSMNEILNNM